MKLRNKKTGEIRDFIINKNKIQTSSAIDCWEYNSLAELNDEWEDYEELEAYYIGRCGTIEEFDPTKDVGLTEMLKQIGNYFETEEEAEKAVEKLKAWKRLKEKGFRFTGIMDEYINAGTPYDIQPLRTERNIGFNKSEDLEWIKDNRADLDLLFGGEE